MAVRHGAVVFVFSCLLALTGSVPGRKSLRRAALYPPTFNGWAERWTGRNLTTTPHYAYKYCTTRFCCPIGFGCCDQGRTCCFARWQYPALEC